MNSPAQTGFPSPADDYLKAVLSPSDLLIKHPAATFFVRAQGCAMTGMGIFDQDILIVDRSLEAVNGSLVVAHINGEFLIRQLIFQNAKVFLVATQAREPKVDLNAAVDCCIWGVVSGMIRQFDS